MKPFVKTSAFFCLFMGFINLITWTILIATGQVDNLDEELVSMIFHWTSEFTMAILLIISGFALIGKKRYSRKIYFLAFGFMFNATQGAVWYYVVNFDLLMIVMLATFTILTVVYAVINYQNMLDLLWLTLGVSIYACINILGNAFNDMEMAYIFYTLPSFLILVAFSIYLFKKDLKIHKKGAEDMPYSTDI